MINKYDAITYGNESTNTEITEPPKEKLLQHLPSKVEMHLA